MSKSSPRALQELMTAVDADVYVDSSASSDTSRSKLLGPRHRRSTYYGRGAGGARKSAPAVKVAVVEASSEASFEFSTAINSYSSASPASMVFSNGQLRAHHFPAVRERAASVSTGSNHSTSPLRKNSSVGSSYSSSTATTKQQQQAGVTAAGSKKRVTFATDGADDMAAVVVGKAVGGQQGKKSGGLLGCMAACGLSSRDGAVEPVARNVNRKVLAF